MTSRGKTETEKLKHNVQVQLHRLMTQLTDLEENKDDMTTSEYEEAKEETLEQLKELSSSLNKLKDGNLSLVDELSNMQLTIQTAIMTAVQTPDGKNVFSKKEPYQLRVKLNLIERDLQLGKMTEAAAVSEKVEILAALKAQGEILSPAELHYLHQQRSTSMEEYEQISEHYGSNPRLLEMASDELTSALT